tara:strand:- start:4970 stop:5356 length:387 start_codon:yes stop_codon:yes gene_type:complete
MIKTRNPKSFKDIKFTPHPSASNGVIAKIELDNGHWVSLVGAPFGGNNKTVSNYGGLYGDGINTFEMLSSSTEKTVAGVKGWQTEAQVMNHIRYLAKLPNREFSRNELLEEKLVAEHEEELMAEYKEL